MSNLNCSNEHFSIPQIAPIIWQIIFLSCIVLLIIRISKNFFRNVRIKRTINKIIVKKREVNWKW